jgi:hypothetical protein
MSSDAWRLTDERAQPLATRPLTQPHPDRLPSADSNHEAILTADGRALAAGADTDTGPVTGLVVLSAAYRARQATCCEAGCRRCPYVA